MRHEVGFYCWNATLTEKTNDSESPIEISSARNELKNETLQKICHEIDQMYIEQDFDTESDNERSAEAVGEAEEMVTLVLKPDTEENRDRDEFCLCFLESPSDPICQFFISKKSVYKSGFVDKSGVDKSEDALYLKLLKIYS